MEVCMEVWSFYHLNPSGIGKRLSESSEDLSHHIRRAVPQLVIRYGTTQLLLYEVVYYITDA